MLIHFSATVRPFWVKDILLDRISIYLLIRYIETIAGLFRQQRQYDLDDHYHCGFHRVAPPGDEGGRRRRSTRCRGEQQLGSIATNLIVDLERERPNQ
jgi:hypothetical protein